MPEGRLRRTREAYRYHGCMSCDCGSGSYSHFHCPACFYPHVPQALAEGRDCERCARPLNRATTDEPGYGAFV